MTTDTDLLDTTPPPKFPADEVPQSGRIQPFQLSFESLQRATEKAHIGIASGKWTAENARDFLKVNCLSTTAIDCIIENAQNSYQYDLLEKHQETNFVAFVHKKQRARNHSRCGKSPHFGQVEWISNFKWRPPCTCCQVL